MGMSMHVCAVKPADETYQRKAAAYRACEAAGVEMPDELIEFFEGEGPDDTGTTVDIDKHESCEPFEADMRQGFQVDVTRLPEGTRYVRFYCSW